jgi:hypothetical protein
MRDYESDDDIIINYNMIDIIEIELFNDMDIKIRDNSIKAVIDKVGFKRREIKFRDDKINFVDIIKI